MPLPLCLPLLYLFGNNSIKRHLLRSFLAVGRGAVAAFGKMREHYTTISKQKKEGSFALQTNIAQ
jgi:hypothetical protein